MNGFKVEESKQIFGAKIKVVGVGGGGGNMINHIAKQGVGGIDLIAANTDAQALEQSLGTKIQLGEKITKGLGAGMIPEVGKKAAEESYEEIKSALEHADIVFIASGLGGGTGTGAAPIVAQAAKEIGALTISVVTKPFLFEGKKRTRLAEIGLNELKKESDSVIVIPNEKLLSIIDKNLGIKDSFKIVDDVLSRAVCGMSGIVISNGDNDINLDFADVKTVMSHRGMALMGVGESSGDNAACEAVKNAIESPLLDNMTINGALGVLVHFYAHPNYPFNEINSAMDIIEGAADIEAHVIWGTTTDKNLQNNFVRVTIVATGFDNKLDEIKDLKNINSQSDATKKERIIKLRKVSGGYNEENSDVLDIPTFMRNQMD